MSTPLKEQRFILTSRADIINICARHQIHSGLNKLVIYFLSFRVQPCIMPVRSFRAVQSLVEQKKSFACTLIQCGHLFLPYYCICLRCLVSLCLLKVFFCDAYTFRASQPPVDTFQSTVVAVQFLSSKEKRKASNSLPSFGREFEIACYQRVRLQSFERFWYQFVHTFEKCVPALHNE